MLRLMLSTTLFLLLNATAFAALEYSKIEYAGCPENAFCQKATGVVRQQWLDELEKFGKDKISADQFNAFLQKNYGVPVATWAAEEAGVLPRIMMWDSPCKQHKKEASRFYIAEIFVKSLKESEIKDFSTLYFTKSIGIENKKPFSMNIPRGDTPLFIENGYYYFLREDEGKYYGLKVNQDGMMKVTNVETIKETPKESVCLKEQVDLFHRTAPSPTFYQAYNCKDIWDKTSKSYKTMLFGWSCN